MDNDNEFSYGNSFKQIPNSPQGPGFGSKILLPFISGVLGACLIGGICFGVPAIRNNIIGEQSSNSSSKSSSTSKSSTQDNSSYDAKLIDIAEFSETAVAVAEKVSPSVVGVTVTYDVSTFGGKTTAQATGSGVIISKDGYIITNNHVVSSSSESYYYQLSEAKSIQIHLYGDDENVQYDAEIIGRDEDTDLAVLKIEAENLPAIDIGDSTNLRVGEFAMSVGNSLGLENSVSVGVISGINREIKDGENEFTTLQTDAAINSGISGGALVNSKGELIGITFMKPATSGVDGIGFAIPISSAMEVVDELIKDGYVKKPFIGIVGRNVTEELAKQYNSKVGIYVDSVTKDSPAEKADIKTGDIITAIDDHEIATIQELNSYKAKNYKVGDKVTLTVYRDNNEIKVELTLEEEPKQVDTEATDTTTQNSAKDRAQTLKDYYDAIDEYYNYFYNY